MKVSAITLGTGRRLRDRPPHAGLRPLAWVMAACHLVARAGGFVKPVLVLYRTQEQQMTPTVAGAVPRQTPALLGGE